MLYRDRARKVPKTRAGAFFVVVCNFRGQFVCSVGSLVAGLKSTILPLSQDKSGRLDGLLFDRSCVSPEHGPCLTGRRCLVNSPRCSEVTRLEAHGTL